MSKKHTHLWQRIRVPAGNTLLLRLIAIAIFYSVLITFLPIRGTTIFKKKGLPQEYTFLQALLIGTDDAYDLYRIDPNSDLYDEQGIQLYTPVDREVFKETQSLGKGVAEISFDQLQEASADVRLQNVKQTIHLPSPNRLIVPHRNGLVLYSVHQERGFDYVSDTGQVQLSTLDAYGGKIFFTALKDNEHYLRIYSPGCHQKRLVPLEKYPGGVKRRLEKMDMPVQRSMKLSPTQDRLYVLDHHQSAKITLVDLLSDKPIILNVPSLQERQVHFSPLFIDSDHLLFSAMDDTRMQTVLYNTKTGQYSLFSEYFTDRIYLTVTGKILLAQSFYRIGDTEINVPFGSRVFFNRIRNKYGDASWSHLDFSAAHGERLLKRAEFGEQFEVVNVEKFYTTEKLRNAAGIRNFENLLTALEVPSHVMSAYKSRASQMESRGKEYVLLDTYR